MGQVTLGDLQLAIMRVLWDHGEATVVEVHDELRVARDLAPTTIATMLGKMERKGVVEHRVDGRRFIYRPRVTEDQVKRSMVRQLTERLFAGNPAALVTHLISRGDIDPAELSELRRILEREQKGRRRS